MSSDRQTTTDSTGSALKALGLTELSLFLCVWTGFALFGSLMFARAAYYQIWPATYPTTQGEVVRCRVRHGAKDELDLRYAYSVNGQRFTGHRYLGRFNLVSEDDVERVVASLPVGTRVTVYYHPDDPNVSQLKAGLNNGVLLGLLLLGVFHAIGIGGLVLVGTEVQRLRSDDPSKNLPIERNRGRIVIRSRKYRPFAVILAAGASSAVVIPFTVGMAVREDGPPTLTLAAIGAGALVTVFAYWLVRRRTILLTLNPAARTLEIPQRLLSEPQDQDVFDFDDVTRIDLETTAYRDGERDVQHSVAPRLTLRSTASSSQTVRLADRYSQPEAEWLAALLREQFCLLPGGEPADESRESVSRVESETYRVIDEETSASHPSTGVQIHETPNVVEIVPATIPLVAVFACAMIPVAASIAAWWLNVAPAKQIAPFWGVAAVTIFAILGACHYVNEQERRCGSFFVLDKSSGEISLPRSDRKLHERQVLGVVNRRGRVDLAMQGNVPESPQDVRAQSFAELNLLIRNDGGTVTRLPVVMAANYLHGVVKAAQRLAGHWNLPYREINADELQWWTAEPPSPEASPAKNKADRALAPTKPLSIADRRKLTVATVAQVVLGIADIAGIYLMALGNWMAWGNWPWWVNALFLLFAPAPLVIEWYKYQLKKRPQAEIEGRPAIDAAADDEGTPVSAGAARQWKSASIR